MAAPLLLVHDDLATIALVRRTLVRAGHSVELATSTADALAFASTLHPALILLAPGVEAGRGPALLQELAARPDTAFIPVLLLGRTVEGFHGSVLPAPFRAETVLRAVDQALAAAPPAPGPLEPALDLAAAETMELDWSLAEPEVPPLAELTRELAVPLPSFGDSLPPEPFDAGPLLEPDPESEPLRPAEDEPMLEAADEPLTFEPGDAPPEDETTGEFTFDALEAAPAAEQPEPSLRALAEPEALEPEALEPEAEPEALEPEALEPGALEPGRWSRPCWSPRRRMGRTASPTGRSTTPTSRRTRRPCWPWPRGMDRCDAGPTLAAWADASHAARCWRTSHPRPGPARTRPARHETWRCRSSVSGWRRRPRPSARPEDARESSAAAMAARIDAEEARAQADLARAAWRRWRRPARSWPASSRPVAAGRRRSGGIEPMPRLAAAEAAEARRLEAEARRLEAEAETERGRAEAARAEVEAVQASGAAEAELLATALREEATRRTEELEIQVQLREHAEARAAEEAAARARAESEVARARVESRRASEHGQALEREASELAERLAGEERAAAEARRQAERILVAEREAADGLRRELAHARSESRRVAEELEAARQQASEVERQLQSLEMAHQEAEATARARHEEALRARQDAEAARREVEVRLRAEEERQTRAALAEAEAEAVEAARRERERARWTVADAGRVTLEDLATLVFRLEAGRATARLELRAADALRVLWLEEGLLASAASTVSTESLLDHALRDGLLDTAAERELRLLRLFDDQLVEALVQRRLVTEEELVPFLQRVTEARALEAFSEPVSFYRLNADTPPPEDRRAAVRPLSALAAEGVRRGLLPEDVERLVPSFRAVPRSLHPVDPVALGLQDRERRLLDAIDGQRTVQALLLAAGVARDAGRRVVAVAVALGRVGLQPPVEAEAEAETAELRWRASRPAGPRWRTPTTSPCSASRAPGATRWPAPSADSAEYDPLRWSGHPDPRVQARAERMQSLLSEAAHALTDDSLRTAYARSLGE